MKAEEMAFACQACGKFGGRVVSFDGLDGHLCTSVWVCPWCSTCKSWAERATVEACAKAAAVAVQAVFDRHRSQGLRGPDTVAPWTGATFIADEVAEAIWKKFPHLETP